MGMRLWLALALIMSGYLVALGVLPWWMPTDASAPNVAAQVGYDISAAFIFTALWSIIAVGVSALLVQGVAVPAGDVRPDPGGVSIRQRWVEFGVIGLGLLALYWPPATARFAHGLEEDYFLTSLFRIACGETPFADFEFLYGPLMIGLVSSWIEVFGFSRVAYFSFYTVQMLVVWGCVIALLQHAITDTRRRWVAYLLLAPFLLDFLNGLNWTSFRFIWAFFAIWILAGGPLRWSRVIGAGMVLGLYVAYSHEYGLSALIATSAVLILRAVSQAMGHEGGAATWGRIVAAVFVFLGVTVGVWLGAAIWATGGDPSAYFELTRFVTEYTLEQGFARFAYYWSLHNLALFMLLSVGVVMAGFALTRLRDVRPVFGDYLWLGSIIYAGVTLKFALQRADYLHMAVPFIPLILTALINPPTRLAGVSAHLRRVMMGAVVIAALAQAIGHVPHGRWAVLASVRGLVHEVTGRPTVAPMQTLAPNLQAGRYELRADTAPLATRFLQDDIKGRKAIFYQGNWDMAAEVGVCPAGFPFYNILYSNPWHPLAKTAQEPGMLVVITEENYVALQNGITPPPEVTLDLSQRLSDFVSSNTNRQTLREFELEYDMWREALGKQLLQEYRVLDKIGRQIILERID